MSGRSNGILAARRSIENSNKGLGRHTNYKTYFLSSHSLTWSNSWDHRRPIEDAAGDSACETPALAISDSLVWGGGVGVPAGSPREEPLHPSWSRQKGRFPCFDVQCFATNSMHCSPPGSSVHEILQARILAWVAIPFARVSSQPRDQTPVTYIADKFFTGWTTWEAPL